MNKLRKDYLEFLEEYHLKANHSTSIVEEDSNSLQDSKKLVSLDDLSLKIKDDYPTQTTRLNIEEKEAVGGVDFNSREIPFRFVCFVFVMMFIALSLFIPKIYIRNNIYYTSRNLIQLQAQLDSLNEENKHIKKQLENIKFKNLTHELDF